LWSADEAGTQDMFSTIRRTIRLAFGYRFTEIVEDDPNHLTLRYGSTKTSFDRKSSRVTQNGRLVAVFDLIEQIKLHQPSSQEGPSNWYITLQLTGARQVEVGQVTDQTDASIVAARISGITNRRVVARQ
jgi:uncharacterized protein (UPF0262 family)